MRMNPSHIDNKRAVTYDVALLVLALIPLFIIFTLRGFGVAGFIGLSGLVIRDAGLSLADSNASMSSSLWDIMY